VVDAQAGVQVGTEVAWQAANERHLPRIVVINRIDRENSSYASALASLQSQFGKSVVPVHSPVGAQDTFKGIVDVISGKARLGEKGDAPDVPAELADEVAGYREQLVEAVAETDDDLINKYLEGEEISEKELRGALTKAVAAGQVVPVFCACSTK